MSGWRKRQIADKIENDMAGADIMAGEGGYSIGTQEEYETFAKLRNTKHFSNTNNPVDFPPAPDVIESLMYSAGLTAQGCWDQMDEYDRAAIKKLTDLILFECIKIAVFRGDSNTAREIKQHFGVE